VAQHPDRVLVVRLGEALLGLGIGELEVARQALDSRLVISISL
jgi:hypothetical protein